MEEVKITSKEILEAVSSLKKETSEKKLRRQYKESKYSMLEDDILEHFVQRDAMGNVRYNQALQDVRTAIVRLLSASSSK